MQSESITDLMAILAFQLGIILFAVRFFGKLVKKAGIPQVLGELAAGIIIGPYALGAVPLPGFPGGIFYLTPGILPVSNELYAFASTASIILLFATGLETDIGLFLRYSVVGGIVGLGGVVGSFLIGDVVGVIFLKASFMDPKCLFLGILSTATSVGITARILSDQKKMDSPEGVTILAAAVFDDVLGIIALAVVMGIVAVLAAHSEIGLNIPAILAIAGKAFGLWLGFTALGLVFSKRLAGFLKIFRNSYDFSILALGIALILSGFFEKQGLAMIIGAYIAGLSLSRSDIALVIRGRIQGLYEFFVPVFFAVMGMMVNFREILSPPALVFGVIYTAAAFLAKLAGCGGPALLLGFNAKGALRIGTGMVPRGEVALIIAGIGIASGILSQQIFSVVILMTLITTLAAPPLLNATLKIAGPGTRKTVRNDDLASMVWQFSSDEIAGLVVSFLLKNLRAEGFYVQTMNIDEGLSQIRKDDIVFSVSRVGDAVTVETGKVDESFVKTAVYEVIVELYAIIQKFRDTAGPQDLKRELLNSESRPAGNLASYIHPECVSLNLQGVTKNEIITELVDLLCARHKILNRNLILNDVLEREKYMSTGMQHGIALPHAKTGGIDNLVVAVGIKKEGVDFDSIDGEKSRLFILIVSPRNNPGPHTQLLAALGAALADETTREEVFNAASPEKLIEVMAEKNGKKRNMV